MILCYDVLNRIIRGCQGSQCFFCVTNKLKNLYKGSLRLKLGEGVKTLTSSLSLVQ